MYCGVENWAYGGVPMSHVDFKERQRPMSLKSPCPLIPLRTSNVDLYCVTYFNSYVTYCRMSILRNAHCHVEFKDQGTQYCIGVSG